jgi:2TM domain
MPGRTYTDDEVREILHRAADHGEGGGGLSREELIEAAHDVGIEASAVQAAIGSMELDREVGEEVALQRKRERKSLVSSFLTWAIITGGLLAMRLFDAGGWWFVWPMGVWAVVLLLRLKGFMFANPEAARERAVRNIEHRRRQKRHRLEPAARVRAPDANESPDLAEGEATRENVRGRTRS